MMKTKEIELMIGSLVGNPLGWMAGKEEVRMFRQSSARLRYNERKEKEAHMAGGGIPIQLSTGTVDELGEQVNWNPLVDLVLPGPNHTKKTLQLDGMCGVWCVVCGVWCVVCGVWCVMCSV